MASGAANSAGHPEPRGQQKPGAQLHGNVISSAAFQQMNGRRRRAGTAPAPRGTCATASSPLARRTSTWTQLPRNTRAGDHAGRAIAAPSPGAARDAHRFRANAHAVDPVHRAEKARDEARARAQVDILGRADLLDAAVVHHGELVGHGERFLLIVRHEQEGDADAALHGLQLDAHLLAQLGIERGQRLVEQQHVGLQHQRARQRDALPLAAGELRPGLRVSLPVRPTSSSTSRTRARISVAAWRAQSELDVLARGEMRKQRVILEDGADVALVGLAVVDHFAVRAGRRRSRLLEAGDQRSVVVLPQPEGPSSEKKAPRGIESETPSTARWPG